MFFFSFAWVKLQQPYGYSLLQSQGRPESKELYHPSAPAETYNITIN